MASGSRTVSAYSAHQPLEHLNRIALSLRLGSYTAEFLYWGVLGAKSWRNYLHTHSFYEICYAFDGAGTFLINDQTHRVSAGDLFVARPNEAHEIVSDEKRVLGICYWAYTLVKDREAAPEASAIDELLTSFVTSSRLIHGDCASVHATVKLLIEETVNPLAGYATAVSALVTKLLLDTARCSADSVAPERIEPKARSASEAAIQSAIRYLRDNLARPLETRDLAAQVHLSERHLRRLFKTVTKTSIHDYVIQLRLQTATQLLLDPNRSIKQVAAAVGYPDVRYFTTLFHKEVGTTPAKFRATGGTRFVRRDEEGG